jgi:hypothetical protein
MSEDTAPHRPFGNANAPDHRVSDTAQRITQMALKWQVVRNESSESDLQIREAVVSAHLGMEHLLDLVLATPFLEPAGDKPARYQNFMTLVSEIGFAKKVRLTEELDLLSSSGEVACFS